MLNQNIAVTTDPIKTSSFQEQYRRRTGQAYKPSAPTVPVLDSALRDAVAEARPLIADGEQIKRFVDVIFRNCVSKGGLPFGGRIALRAFSNSDGKVVLDDWEPFARTPVARAVELASQAARRSQDRGAVFAPPVCLFNDQGRAAEKDVLAGPVIVAELDQAPTKGKKTLEAILGTATLVIASGGSWVSPEGATEAKLHLYWRLASPAVSEQEKAILKAVRKRVADLVDGDTSAAPLCHPLRWPGSWHTKAGPRLCRIIGGAEEHQIDLDDAAARLGVDTIGSTAGSRRPTGLSFTTIAAWTSPQLIDVAKMLPNDDLSWDLWNTIGMAFFDAAHGAPEGFDAFDLFSLKSTKYDPSAVKARWEHYASSPPDRISGTWLINRVREAVDPLYCLPQPDLTAQERARLHEIFSASAAADTDNSAWQPVRADSLWPEPADIFGDDAQVPPADFPTHALPKTLEAWSISEARRKGVSTAFAASAALGAISAAVGASLRIKPRQLDNWTEPSGLWVVLVAEPGSGKSPIIAAALAPLRDLDRLHSAEDRKKHSAWQQLSRRAARKGEATITVPREPPIRRYVIDDITSESFIRIAADNPRGLMRASDEWASIMGAIGAYKRQGDGDRGMMLRTFDGGEISVDRVGAGNLRADSALQSILAGSQPEKIGKALSDLSADGMAQRTLFVMSDDKRRAGLDELPDAAAQQQYRSVVQGLASAEYVFDKPIVLTPDGYAACREAQQQISLIGRYPGSPAALRGHLEKWEKIVFRIILAVHAFEEFSATGCAATGHPVPLERVKRCIEIARFFIRHQVAFYDRFFGPDDMASEARWVAGHLLTKPELARLTHRTIYDARKALSGSENAMRRKRVAVMQELVEAGWCSVESWKEGGPDSWLVNPGIHSRFADRAERERQQRASRQREIAEAGRARRGWLNSDSLSRSGEQS